MASDNVFGSDELTPELLRSATFTEHEGRYDAGEVRSFLDRVASSLEVFMTGDAASALRAEFSRNAAIAQQVLDAGQTASEQLRRQAAEDARRILDETRQATHELREDVEAEISQSREQVEEMRAQFIQDLRDLYDRIGASLYRFERAAEEQRVAPIAEPARAASETPAQQHPEPHEPSEPAGHAAADERAEGAPGALPEGAKPPAWQQLPPEAWAGQPGAGEGAEGPSDEQQQGGGDPFAVVEDEPLAQGEPLVDLREFAEPPAAAGEPVAPAAEDPPSGSWLDASEAADAPAAGEPAGDPAASGEASPAADLGGSWLVDAPADIAGAGERDPALEHDDALAEALIAGSPFTEEEQDGEQPQPEGPSPSSSSGVPGGDAGAASPDAVAVRQLILDSLAAGQTREAVEAYLRDHMGFVEPGALVDAALGSAGQH